MSDAEMNEPMEPLTASDGEQQNVPSQATPGPGAQLAAHRIERGWSVEYVASQLNLAPKQIQRIENDDYQALPGAVVRGFVRAYAKLLKVDAAPLLAAMPSDPAPANAPPAARRMAAASFSEPRFPEISDRSGLSGKHITAVAVVILIAGGIWAARQTGYLSSVSDKLKDGFAKLSGATGQAAKSASANGEAAAPVTSSAPVTESSTTGAVVAQPAPFAEATPPVAEVAPNAEDAAAAGKDSLVLKARQDSWIEIKGAGNRTLLSRVLKAGETETLEVKEPLSLVIGNAAGVDATLRGNPVALKSNTSSNVARLSLK